MFPKKVKVKPKLPLEVRVQMTLNRGSPVMIYLKTLGGKLPSEGCLCTSDSIFGLKYNDLFGLGADRVRLNEYEYQKISDVSCIAKNNQLKEITYSGERAVRNIIYKLKDQLKGGIEQNGD